MPLTTTPILLDDIERNRRIFDRLSQGMQGASKQGVDALVMMENLAKQGRAEERQKALDAENSNRLVLERKDKDADQVRRAAAEARAAELHTMNVPVLRRKAAREEEDYQAGKLVLERKDAQDALKAHVATAIRDAVPPDELARRAVDIPALHPLAPEDLHAEYETQRRTRGDAESKRALAEREQARKDKDSAAGRARDYAAAKAAEQKVDAPDTKGPDAIRKEFNAQPGVKDFPEVDNAYKKMKAASASSSPAGDLSLIYSFMKMQDPGSTVREAEFEAAAKAGSFGEQMKAQVERIGSGQILTPAQKADFLKQAENFYRIHKAAYDATAQRYSDIAQRRGFNLADVIGPSSAGSGMTPEQRRARIDELMRKRGAK